MSRHVLIVGGGIIGLCTAYYCLERSWRVTVVERQPEEREGCSFGNAGMIVPSHFVPLAAPGMVALGLKWMGNPESPFYIKPRLSPELFAWGYRFWRASTSDHVRRAAPLLRDLHLASRARFEALASLPEFNFGLVQRGLLMLCQTQAALAEETHAAQRANDLGVPAEVLDPAGIARLDPAVEMEVRGGVYYPLDCHLTPQLLMRNLRDFLRNQGCEFHWNQEVIGWRKERQRIVSLRTTTGDLSADQYVLCAGSWSPATARDLRLTIPMQAGKGYSLTLNAPRQLPQLCSILTEARVAVTPMGTSLRFGGTMELSGLDLRIDPRRVRGIINAATRYFPAFKAADFADIQPWSGLRPCSPDGLPYLGRTRHMENLVVATGHAMMGLSLGPITGEIVADMLSEEPLPLDVRLCSPDRFE
jgi:D-amino-acid dehydrogenase